MNDNPYAKAIDTIRETAKWLATAFAAIAAALIAGGQLSNVGELETARLVLAAGCAAVALAGIGSAVWLVIDVMTPGHLTLTDLATEARLSDIRAFIDNNRDFLREETDSVKDLSERYRSDLAAYRSAKAAYDQNNSQPNKRDLDATWERLKWINGIISQIMVIASYERTRRTFRGLRPLIFANGGLAAAGIMGFVWAANPEEGAGSPPPAQIPQVLDVMLTDEGTDLLRERVGEHCAPTSVRVLKLGERGGSFDALTVPSERCASLRFTLNDAMGTVSSADAK